MFSASLIDPRTIQAYLDTEYRVHGEPGFTLGVGQVSAALRRAQQRHRAVCSAFVTACNPFSQQTDEATNAARQAALAQDLSSRNLSFLPGLGQHPGNQWPGEDSFLVFGLTLEAAQALGARLDQNGFVWAGADAIPQLILLR